MCVKAESKTSRICRTGVPGACDWSPQVGLVYVLNLWFLHKTS